MTNNLANFLILSVLGVWVLCDAHGGYLYPPPQGEGFLVPSFNGQPDTQYSEWDVFYTPNTFGNYPDFAAPFGGPNPTTASAAGFTPPPNSSPADPLAFWNVNNPTISQVGADAFIIGPGSTGNIYSFSGVTSFVVSNTTPYALGTAVFQFQTEGTMVDFASIRLNYNGGSQQLAPTEYLREYAGSASAFGGSGSRIALQWDLTGLGITSYTITFQSLGSSMSFQRAILDTARDYAEVVPQSRSWNAGSGAWSNGANWLQGSSSVANGNVRFANTGAAQVMLDGDRTVGEVIFSTAANTTISGNSTLTANTGVTTTEAATGIYAIDSNYQLGALNYFTIAAGEVRMNGLVSGAYGLVKDGDGLLVLSNNNTFTGGVGVEGGTLRMEGANAYAGSTGVLVGKLVVAADAPNGAPGALGHASTPVVVGAASSIHEPTPAAELILDGNITVGRNITLAEGGTDGVFGYEKRLGAVNASAGAVFAGSVSFGTAAGNVKLTAHGVSDRLVFSGPMSGGTASKSVTLDGAGTVVYSGSDKTYHNSTVVASGTLLLEGGVKVSGLGNWTVQPGARLQVNDGARLQVSGILGGGGEFVLDGGILSGTGTIDKAFVLDDGDAIAPGSSVGILHTIGETWDGGGSYLWEIRDANAGAGTGWDLVEITGQLLLELSGDEQFIVALTTLATGGTAGLLAGFDPAQNYSWTILTATGGITGFQADAFAVDAAGFANAFDGTFSISQLGTSLMLNYAAVPEPGTIGFIALAVLGLFWRGRKSDRR